MSRKPYSGSQRKLVIGIDVGTTFSGISYSILDPGIIPVIQGVNRFPAQEKSGGDAKIPTVLYYDRNGIVRAAGAEVLLESNIDMAIDEQWVKVEWFKLHLRPSVGHTVSHDSNVPPLPLNKTVVQVFGDYLRYLYQCTRTYIQETHTGGSELWSSLEGRAEIVLTHPNGWEGQQQALMRSAAIHGGLIPDTPVGHARVQFVTEGEASLHYCIGNKYSSDVLKGGEGVIIVDAGGGTIDLSAYYMKHEPNWFEEIAPATCHFQGSVFVSRRARTYLENKLSSSQYGSPDDIAHIVDCFDKSTKLAFKDPSQTAFIRFGSTRDSDPSVDIKLGQLKLKGSEVAAFFEPSIAVIRTAIQEQKAAAHIPVTSVLLVGGFAASDWLFSNLQTAMRPLGLRLSRPDGHLGKAVADGAVSFYLDRLVSVRIARTTFGARMYTIYVPSNPEHLRRSSTVYQDDDGEDVVPNGYDVILAKGTRVTDTTMFSRSFYRTYTTTTYLTTVTQDITAYRGENKKPQWTDVEPEMYTDVCQVVVDLRSLAPTLTPQTGKNGKQYYRFDYKIELLFGLTEHKAQVCWQENGQEKRSPARIVYDQAVARA